MKGNTYNSRRIIRSIVVGKQLDIFFVNMFTEFCLLLLRNYCVQYERFFFNAFCLPRKYIDRKNLTKILIALQSKNLSDNKYDEFRSECPIRIGNLRYFKN